MNNSEFQRIIRRRLAALGTNANRAALEHGLPKDAVKSVLAGHEPGIGRASDVCEALGLELTIGEPFAVAAKDAGDISKALRALGEEFERLNEHGRIVLLYRLSVAFPEIMLEVAAPTRVFPRARSIDQRL